MECPSCEYENPQGTKVCLECGAGLRPAARRKAEDRFLNALETARTKAEDRLRRASKRRPTPRD